MKTIKCEFIDGIKEIEVDDNFAAVYESILAYEKKVERKETRRHISFDALKDAGFEFEDRNADINSVLKKNAQENFEIQYVNEEAERHAHIVVRKLKWLESRLMPTRQKPIVVFIITN